VCVCVCERVGDEVLTGLKCKQLVSSPVPEGEADECTDCKGLFTRKLEEDQTVREEWDAMARTQSKLMY
jgi:hypothetical protein